ncbi:leucine-rich repeat-containing protein kinase family protein [Methylobacterium oryzisoli]|uniref:leucine-rich repeat-containing protein kinase family protein n=1 Tax=Methylobacterium oryzisoli TaxID=3385502 RepID=UPI0038924A3B
MSAEAATLRTLEALRAGDLAGATELRLGPGLDEFPRDIFGLADTLELLDLSGAGLTALPDDLGRLHRLRVLFGSGNRFERLPPGLGDCPSLSQIGLRGVGMREVPGEALPRALRWLTLTDNRIDRLPPALGERPRLQKLLLSGNRLRALPNDLAGAPHLELLRVAANHLEALPPWLVDLPRLAWVSWSGNPCEPAREARDIPGVPWAHLASEERLGEGASGWVHRAIWSPPTDEPPRPVALKLFKGAMTSDGLPEREMAACLAAGGHPRLTGALGRVTGHPDGIQGLVMPLLPSHWRVLAGPPSLASCSRDEYDPGLTLTRESALRLARGVASGAAHLHARGLLHGDLYGHNILWDGRTGDAVLSDFGAASALPAGALGRALQRIEVRAWGILLGELIARMPTGSDETALRTIEQHCIQQDRTARPSMTDILALLRPLGPD